MNDNQHELCKAIVSELIDVSKDESYPVEFREDIRYELNELKDDVERTIALYE